MKLLKVRSVAEVQQVIAVNFQPIQRLEKIKISEALHRVVGQDVFSPEILPPFSRSSVDGYAVNAQDTYGAGESLPAFLDYLGEVKMGEKALAIKPGGTSYIPTGGMLPSGADAVVMVEYTEKIGNQVMVYRPAAPGENVFKAGDDVKQGELVLKKGSLLQEAEIGVLAALGIEEVTVYEKPIVGILSTGNELVSSTAPKLKEGQIRDINSLTLACIAQKLGARVIQGGICSDDFEEIFTRAKKLLEEVDVLLLSGGSSVGALDFTAQVLRKLTGDNILVEGISVKPGKPTILAQKGNKALWGLPGHPVSALLIFNYFGELLLDRLSGYQGLRFKKILRARLTRNIPGGAGRTDWVRVKLTGTMDGFEATPIFGKSGLITTLVDSHGYLEIPEEKEGLTAGSWVEVTLWN